MSTVIVTELVVDARPAEAGADRYEAAMQKVERAAQHRLEREERLERALAKSAGSLQLVPQASDRATQAWNRLAAATDPVMRATQQFERAATQAATAVRGGAVSYDVAAVALERLRTKQEQQLLSLNAVGKASQSSADSLRMSYDTAYANAARYAEVERDVATHVQARSLSVDQGNVILAGAATRFKHMGEAANQNVRLTTGQVQNLGYQLNDVSTMLLMGASPFQIIASQGGQVVQALGDGPQGVRGSIAAIGSSIAGFARSIHPAVYAVAGATAAVGALYYLTRGPQARSAEESVASFKSAVDSLEAAWKGAGEAAERHYETARRSGDNASAALLNVGGDIRDLQADLQATLRDLNTSDELSAPIIWQSSSEQSAARREVTALYTEARVGKISVSELADEMLRIRLDPTIDDHARAFADEIRKALAPAEELERRIHALNVAAAKMAAPNGTMGRNDLPDDVFDSMFGGVGQSNRFGPGMDDVREGLRGQRSEFEQYIQAADQAKMALANFDLSPVDRQIAETNAEYDRQADLLKGIADNTIGLTAIEEARAAALGLIRREADAEEQHRSAGFALDLKAVSASTEKTEGDAR